MEKIIVMLPTYNEAGNIQALIKKILELKIKGLEVLVVDDNSPDDTAQKVRALKNKKAHVLLRTKHRGRGYAGIAGFKKALELGADYIIEMDADFSHDPKYIPRFLKEIKGCDIVLGSRLVKGAKDSERTVKRRLLTISSNAYVRTTLGLKVKDCNSGYRCFTRDALRTVLPRLKASGPDIIQESLFHARKLKIKEIPIVFKGRAEGESKLGLKQFIRGVLVVLRLRLS